MKKEVKELLVDCKAIQSNEDRSKRTYTELGHQRFLLQL